MFNDYSYPDTRRVSYPCGDNFGTAVFVPVCEECCRFVKADDTIAVSEINGLNPKNNATCSRCGRTRMLFEGFF